MNQKDIAEYALERARKEYKLSRENRGSMESHIEGIKKIRGIKNVLIGSLALSIGLFSLPSSLVNSAVNTQKPNLWSVAEKRIEEESKIIGLESIIDLENQITKRRIEKEIQQYLVTNKSSDLGKSLQLYPLETLKRIRDGWAERNLNPDKNLRAGLEKAIERARPYLPLVFECFESQNVPKEFALKAIVESHWRNIRSEDKATGQWQLTKATAIRNGAIIDDEKDYDERLNPIISSCYAASELAANYRILGNWDLTNAAYNSGNFPWAYKRSRERYGDGKLSLENYLKFLGESIEEKRFDVQELRQALYHVAKMQVIREVSEAIDPNILNSLDSQKVPLRVYQISSEPFKHIVEKGDNLTTIAINYLNQTYGIETDETNVGTRRLANYLVKERGGDSIIVPGESIIIRHQTKLKEIEYFTGRNLKYMNPHIINPNVSLPEGARIVIKT